LLKLKLAESRMAWRSLMISLASLLIAALVTFVQLNEQVFPAAVAQALVGLLTASSWFAAVWFLLIDTSFRRLWLVANVGALALVLFGGGVGLGFAITISAIFLTMRRYRTWRLVSDRRRAVGFALGIVALLLLIFTFRLNPDSAAGGFSRELATWALVSLTIFWAFSLFRLAIQMRLHFLRLRPKLAVSAFLIGVVPFLALAALGTVVGYSLLGGARSARLNSTLDGWQEMSASGSDLSGAVFDTTFAWPKQLDSSTATIIPAPDWVPPLGLGMRQMVANSARLKGQQTGDIKADTKIGRAHV